MSILFNEKRKLFALQTPRTTYAFAVDGNGVLVHLYWGDRIDRLEDLPDAAPAGSSKISTENDAAGRLEYRTQEAFQYGEPALRAAFPDGVRFNLAISRISLSQRTSYAYGIYRFAGRRYDLTDKDEYFFERAYGGYFALSYPLSHFDRIETSLSLTNSDKEVVGTIEDRKALLVSNSASFTHDNSLWGPSGPLDGSRFNVTLAFTSDVQYSNVNYYTVIADYRHYLRLSQRSAFASRFWVFLNDGKESRRFFMGGSWDLRGYPRWSIRGEKLWLTSQELRFPFIDQFAVQFPFGGVSFWSIRGALFFDAGGAWDKKYVETLASIGGGVRMNLGGLFVLRYDLGKRIENNFRQLQDGLFHQFFFGWDF